MAWLLKLCFKGRRREKRPFFGVATVVRSLRRCSAHVLVESPTDPNPMALSYLGLPYRATVLMSDGAFIHNPRGEMGRLFFIGHGASWTNPKGGEPTKGVILGFGDEITDGAIWSPIRDDLPAAELAGSLSPRWVKFRDLLPGIVESQAGLSLVKYSVSRPEILTAVSALSPPHSGRARRPPAAAISIDDSRADADEESSDVTPAILSPRTLRSQVKARCSPPRALFLGTISSSSSRPCTAYCAADR